MRNKPWEANKARKCRSEFLKNKNRNMYRTKNQGTKPLFRNKIVENKTFVQKQGHDQKQETKG